MKKLNLDVIKKSMQSIGLNASDVAKKIEVSRESVSNWLSESSFPRPNKLLKLSLLLNLNRNDIVLDENLVEPKIAFRKRGATKITALHIEKAKETGFLLKALVPYLPFNKFKTPSTLINPINDYSYIKECVPTIRDEVNLKDASKVELENIIKLFKDRQAVLIPVLWGKKDTHENALHIYLPDTKTTWVFINLDVEIHDLKFWMAHELGHVLSPTLDGDDAEDFADKFAGELLFPFTLSKKLYNSLERLPNDGTKVNLIKDTANRYTISPITVYKQVNAYASFKGKKELSINSIFGAAKNLSKEYENVSSSLFPSKDNILKKYIEFANVDFNSPFFDTLAKYINEKDAGPGYIKSILKSSHIDAKAIYDHLT